MTSNLKPRIFRCVLIGLILGMAGGSALAILGQSPSLPAAPSSIAGLSSMPSTGARIQGSTPATATELYTVREDQLENGTLVREYVSQNGVVFALTWTGPVLPDLKLMLGTYFNVFEAGAAQARKEGRRGMPALINQARLVLSSQGRMRDFYGYAYAPELVPSNVNIRDALQ